MTPLALHACCGPCSLSPSKHLREEGFEPTLLWDNPNIQPVAEHDLRLATLLAWADAQGIAVVRCERGAGERAGGHQDGRRAARGLGSAPAPRWGLTARPAAEPVRPSVSPGLRRGPRSGLYARVDDPRRVSLPAVRRVLGDSPATGPRVRPHARDTRLAPLLCRRHAREPRAGDVSPELLRLPLLRCRGGDRAPRARDERKRAKAEARKASR